MVYNYTKPRGPIAAMYNSPGPSYSLPGLVGHQNHDPRATHSRNPAYSFGGRYGKLTDDSSPGPCYMPEQKIYRNGKDGAPQFSQLGRPKDSIRDQGPGPGAYYPQNSDKDVYPRGASHSFGGRYRNNKTDDTPGPNAYPPDPMLGKTKQSQKKSAPSYSITGRSRIGGFHEDLQKTPGPGAYGNPNCTSKKSAPAHSITSRHQMPGDTTQKPGPGAYATEPGYNQTKKRAPAAGFGIRHSNYKTEVIGAIDLD